MSKKKDLHQGDVVKPLISSECNFRCQVYLLDFQSQLYREFKFIMVYQDL